MNHKGFSKLFRSLAIMLIVLTSVLQNSAALPQFSSVQPASAASSQPGIAGHSQAFCFKITTFDPMGTGNFRLIYEVKPLQQPFNGIAYYDGNHWFNTSPFAPPLAAHPLEWLERG